MNHPARTSRTISVFLGLALTIACPLRARAAEPAPQPAPWAGWQYLIGEWTGEGGGQPGQGSGTFSFEYDVEKKILVRKNRSDYPATADRPAAHHEDLMVVYRAPGDAGVRAIYFDNEDHVIQYAAEAAKDGASWTFVSDASGAGPRFRLTYTKTEGDRLAIRFEIAPPGKPDAFAPYLTAMAHRGAAPR